MTTALAIEALPTITLLDLPTEIRLEIWTYTLFREFRKHVEIYDTINRKGRPPFKPVFTALFYVSNLVSNEALDVFYARNQFYISVSSDLDSYIDRMDGPAVRRIRNLEICFSLYMFMPDEHENAVEFPPIPPKELWFPILSNLRRLVLDVWSPVKLFGKPAVEWAEFLERYFVVLSAHAPACVCMIDWYSQQFYDPRDLLARYFPGITYEYLTPR